MHTCHLAGAKQPALLPGSPIPTPLTSPPQASSSGRQRQPETAQYALFKWQLQEAAEAARSSACSSSSLGGMAGKTRRSSSPAGGDADADAGPGSTISGAAERTIKRESTFASVVSFAMEDGGPPTPNLEVGWRRGWRWGWRWGVAEEREGCRCETWRWGWMRGWR